MNLGIVPRRVRNGGRSDLHSPEVGLGPARGAQILRERHPLPIGRLVLSRVLIHLVALVVAEVERAELTAILRHGIL